MDIFTSLYKTSPQIPLCRPDIAAVDQSVKVIFSDGRYKIYGPMCMDWKIFFYRKGE